MLSTLCIRSTDVLSSSLCKADLNLELLWSNATNSASLKIVSLILTVRFLLTGTLTFIPRRITTKV